MKITNNLNLPEPLLNGIIMINSEYNAGESDISATQLISPVRQYFLMKEHRNEITKDASDMIKAIKGSSLHHIIEMGNIKGIVEERAIEELIGWKVSGKFDYYDPETKTLWDYKTTNVWEYVFGLKPEREQQLNIYAYLFRNKYPIEKLKICFIFDGWMRKQAERSAASDYPPREVLIYEVRLWTEEEQEFFILNRLADFEKVVKTDELPFCTDEERWVKPTTYACMKDGRKSAVRVFNDLPFAQAYVKENKGLRVEIRKGEIGRCALYCDVRDFCDQYKESMRHNEEE